MVRRIQVRAIKKEEPIMRLYVLALIALARELQDERQADTAQAGEENAHERT
jgi:hypothetical protein